VTLTEKYQSRMNRYIKKEEMATKALAEVSRTLNQLNEYNNELVTENERLKLEDKRKMESTAFRDSQYMNDTRKSLYTSQ
jgi:regulator of replication initiation timing